MRPPGPVPGTCRMSTPSSRATRRTDGPAAGAGPSDTSACGARGSRLMFTTSPRRWRAFPFSDASSITSSGSRGAAARPTSTVPGFALSRSSRAAAASSAFSAGPGFGPVVSRCARAPDAASFIDCGSGWGGVAEAPWFSSTLRIAWPTFTLSPCLTLTSFTVPATLEGTSIVALSVSSSRTGWSFAIASPGFTRMRTTSPAVTFSPSSGRMKSAIDLYAMIVRAVRSFL